MCGICGIIYGDHSRPVDRTLLESINRTMIYRGPDDEGYHVGRGAGLAQRRLSIIDVTGGHQPIYSEDASVVAVCNGEIYNFEELKNDLRSEGHVFKAKTDSEVLPHLYERDGAGLVKRLNGMFGLAVWDDKTRTLILARDRMGQKPLYWAHQDGMFIFASELKAILAHPDIEAKLCRKSLSKYLAYEYVPAPHTIFENINKLEPGQLLQLKDGNVSLRKYWDVPIDDEVENISENVAIERLLHLLEKSVERRLISDVPLGVFLSGGIDSSAMVAMMARLRDPKDIKTFSIAFAEKSFDESSYARQVAEYFGTDHREQVLSPDDLLALLPAVSDLLDEPMGDASIVPTFALSKFTRQFVTVAIGGDGGDELFAGYPTFQADVHARRYRMLPGFIRHSLIEPLIKRLPVSDDNISLDFKAKQFIKGARIEDISKHIVWIGSFSPDEQHDLLSFPAPANIFEDIFRHAANAGKASEGNRVLYAYQKLYMAEDILTKVDRASMWTSLEARAPFLDHEFVEFVARLPYSMKLHKMTMKYILKKAMDPLLPKGIATRSKKGFGMPVAKWIKGPIKDMTFDLLAPDKIKREGLFNPAEITRLLGDHISGKVDNRKKLWTLIVFEKWLDRYGGGSGGG